MFVAEDVWDQVSRLDMFKEGRQVQDKVKNSLCCFTYNHIDLDLKKFNLDRWRIRIHRNLNNNFAILKPDKGNGIVLMKQSDYVTSDLFLRILPSLKKSLLTPLQQGFPNYKNTFLLYWNETKLPRTNTTLYALKQHISDALVVSLKFTKPFHFLLSLGQ